MAKLLTARGNGYCSLQQLTARMQTLAADVSGCNLTWRKPAEYELWSADQLTTEAREPFGSEDSLSTADHTLPVSTYVCTGKHLIDFGNFRLQL